MLAKNQAELNAAYWANKPPPVRALNLMDPDTPRMDAAYDLVMKGYNIFAEVDADGWDAWTVMSNLSRYGYTWYPNMVQVDRQTKIEIAPGIMVPTIANYDPLHPPPGSIKISLDLSDYPPFDPPKPPPPTDAHTLMSPVGQQLHDIYYAEQPWDKTVEGAVTGEGGVPADSRGKFKKVYTASLFSRTGLFLKVG